MVDEKGMGEPVDVGSRPAFAHHTMDSHPTGAHGLQAGKKAGHRVSLPLMDDVDMPQGQSGLGNALTCLGIGCGAALLLALLASVVAFAFKDKLRDALADQAYTALEEGIDASDLENREKQELIEQVARLRDGVQSGQVGMDDFGEFMKRVSASPLQPFLILSHVSSTIQADGGFSESERAESKALFGRYVRGRIEGQFSKADDRELASLLGMSEGDDNVNIEIGEDLDHQVLREAVDWINSKVEDAQVPDSAASPDLSGVLEEILDSILK